MHQSAMDNAKLFVEKYLHPDTRLEIIDVGSFDVNGTLRPLFERSGWSYTGVDIAGTPRENVDIHIAEDGTIPCEDDSFDVVVSSSCFEHDHAFWKTFSEMIRVAREEGLIYLNVPSRGPYHPHPLDCWRFEVDAYRALSAAFEQVELLESYITPLEEWHDNVGIFRVRKAAEGRRNTHSSTHFKMVRRGSGVSARVVLPLLFRHFVPGRVADLGCGSGVWLKVARELGVEDVLGLDSASTEEIFMLESSAFMPADLSRPIPLDGAFDLVMSLEAAGQLPSGRARGFVSDLTRLGDVVLFSSAIPFQGGVAHESQHWPEYWAGLFAERGFLALDLIRPLVWEDERVEWWYRQNLLLFCRKSRAAELFPGVDSADIGRLTRIHRSAIASAGERIGELEKAFQAEERLRKAVSGESEGSRRLKRARESGPAETEGGNSIPRLMQEERLALGRMRSELEGTRAVNAMLERKLKEEAARRDREFNEYRSAIEKRISGLKRNLANERARNADLVRSTSWKVTRPLREAKDFFLNRLSKG